MHQAKFEDEIIESILDLEDSLNLETVSADGKDLTEEQRATKEAEIVQTLRLFKNSVAHYKTFFPEIEHCKKEIVEKLDKDKDDLFEAYDEDADGVREDKLRARLLPAITKYVKERADLSAAAGKRKKDAKKVDELDEARRSSLQKNWRSMGYLNTEKT